MRHQLKGAIALINPKPVRAGKIIANVQVRKQVIVHVAKRDSQAPFAKRSQRTRFSVDDKHRLRRHISKRAVGVVEIKSVSLRQFTHPAGVRDREPALPFRFERRLAVDPCDDPLITALGVLKPRGRIGEVHPVDVMGHVQIEITIAIDVRQSQRTGGAGRVEARYFAQLKAAAAIIEEQPRAGLNPVNEQIFIAVVVHVGKDRTGTHFILVGNTGRLGYGTKTKVALVQIQSVVPLNIAEVNVGQIISVDVSNGHTGAVVSDHVFVILQSGKAVDKLNPARSRVDQFKALGSRSRRLHYRTLGQWAATLLGDNRHNAQRNQKNKANRA